MSRIGTRTATIPAPAGFAAMPSPVETRALSDFAIAVVEGRPVRIPVEHRSITSANARIDRI